MSMEGERLVSQPERVAEVDVHMHKGHWHGGFGVYLLWFIVIAVLIWLILYSLRPTWVVVEDDPTRVDSGRLLLAALIVAFIIVIIIWAVRSAGWGSNDEVSEVDVYEM